MKRRSTYILALSSLACACSFYAEKKSSSPATSPAAVSSLDEEASNSLYLDDLAASVTEDDSPADPVDPSVQVDGKTSQLEKMSAMIFDKLDKDDSGDLTLDEFLALPSHKGKFGQHKTVADQEPSADKKAKSDAKLTEIFNTYAGDDKLLSSEEAVQALAALKPKVGKFRARHRPDMGDTDNRRSARQGKVMEAFDLNHDGNLDDEEKDGMKESMEARSPRWERRDPRMGHRENKDYAGDKDHVENGPRNLPPPPPTK